VWGGSGAAVAVAFERVPERVQRGRQVGEFLEVQFAEGVELARALAGEVQADHALVVGVGLASHQSGGLGAVDQFDGAVVAQQQVVGNVADRGSPTIGVAADGEQELMLPRGQAGCLGLLFAPSQEAAQSGTEAEKPLVVVVAGRGGHVAGLWTTLPADPPIVIRYRGTIATGGG
jgi:hypothetical protein